MGQKWSKLLNLTASWFPHLYNADDHTYFRLVHVVNEMKRTVNLAQSQGLGNCFSDAYCCGLNGVRVHPQRFTCWNLGPSHGNVKKKGSFESWGPVGGS